MRFLLFLLVFFTHFNAAFSQMPKMNIGHVYGKVIDAKTKTPMGYTSVALLTPSDSLIDGQLTEDNGDFSLNNLPLGKYKLRITSVGYTTVIKDISIGFNNADQELGNIPLAVSEELLKEAVITADRSSVELKLDRKVVNVDKDISARGGTATDVMKNVPGVSVDASGEVTLRNSSPIIYVDGKPTQMTLDQIPADQIERVEVITNPSAKFEAAATGGILNIVLKRNVKPGYNGMVNLGVGTNEQYNGMALFNLREKKFGFNVSYNINSVTNRPRTYTDRKNYAVDSTGDRLGLMSSSYQDNFNENKRMFQFGRIGFDYYIDNRNTLSISENIMAGNFGTNAEQDYNYKDGAGNILFNGNRVNTQNAGFKNFTTTIDFKHTYAKVGKEWNLMLLYTYNDGFGKNRFSTTDYDTSGNILPNNPSMQRINNKSQSNQFVGQWDFTTPLAKESTLDFGLRLSYKGQQSKQNSEEYNYALGDYQEDSLLSNDYRIDDVVGAAYIAYGQTVKKFTYQIGLRYEHTYYAAHTPSGTFSYSYPKSADKLYESLFPSLNLAYNINKEHQVQFNVSRKIDRPNFFQNSPFIFFSDRYNFRTGNPLLRPEFITQAELNYNLTSSKGVNFLTSVYARYHESPITGYAYRQTDTSDVLINTFDNARYEYGYGWENTLRITAVKNLDINLNGNVYKSYIAPITGKTVGNGGWAYFVKGMVSYKFPLDIILQVNGTYESPRYMPQGTRIAMWFIDASLSKDFMKMVTVNLSVNDIANTKINGTSYNTPEFTQMQTMRRDVRFVKLTVSFKFGKMDASFFKRSKLKKPDMPKGGGMDEGF